jgi:hypothetical protein
MRNYPPDEANFRIHPVIYPLQGITVLGARPLLRMLFLAVAVVLLIACANLAGLLLVRAIGRHRETAVRLAIGAPAAVLLRQAMLESLALSASGGLLGIGLICSRRFRSDRTRNTRSNTQRKCRPKLSCACRTER